MQAKLLTLTLLAALLVGGAAWPGSAQAKPKRGYFGNYNPTYYYGRSPTQYYRSYQGTPYPSRPYPYYQSYGNSGTTQVPGYSSPYMLPMPRR